MTHYLSDRVTKSLMLRQHRMMPLMSAALLLTAYAADVLADEAANLSGKALFQKFCTSCDGEQARGDGPVAPYMRAPDRLTDYL